MSYSHYANLAAFYDRLQEADYEKIGAYYHKLLKENNADKGILLDLACGTGMLARYFAALNYDVIGSDVSPEMLSEAVKKPCNNIQYLCQDMTRLNLYGTIDCCICALDGINHLPGIKAAEKAFSRISLFMNKGGVLIFDVNTLYKHKEILSGNTFVYDLTGSADLGGIYCVWQNSVFARDNDGRVDMTLDIFEREERGGNNWRRSTENITERAYPLSVIEKTLKSAGFGKIHVYDWLSVHPADEMSEKAVFTAVKL